MLCGSSLPAPFVLALSAGLVGEAQQGLSGLAPLMTTRAEAAQAVFGRVKGWTGDVWLPRGCLLAASRRGCVAARGCQRLPDGLPSGCHGIHTCCEVLDLGTEFGKAGCRGCHGPHEFFCGDERFWLPGEIVYERLADNGCQWLPVAGTAFELAVELRR